MKIAAAATAGLPGPTWVGAALRVAEATNSLPTLNALGLNLQQRKGWEAKHANHIACQAERERSLSLKGTVGHLSWVLFAKDRDMLFSFN